MRAALVDTDAEREFTERGFVVADALPPDAIARLLEVHAATSAGDGFSFSMQLPATEVKVRTRVALRDVHDRHIAPLLVDFDVMVEGFVTKAAGGGGDVPAHLDWSQVDESRHRSVNVWLALTEATASNGAMAVVPGSHRLPVTLRGSRTPSVFAASQQELVEQLEVVPMAAGQVLFYEPRVIHASAPNRSGAPRVGAVLALTPSEAVPVHYVGDGTRVREFEVDDGFFLAYAVDHAIAHDPNVDALLAGRPSREVAIRPPITSSDLQALRPDGGRSSLWQRLSRRR